jgi:hypothetical protein
MDPVYTRLYAFRGFRYCELLLDQGESNEVVQRASEWVVAEEAREVSAFSRGLTRIMLCKAMLKNRDGFDFARAMGHADSGLALIKEAAQSQHDPRALILRADVHRHAGRFEEAAMDLASALSCCESMGLMILKVECGIADILLTLDERASRVRNLQLLPMRSVSQTIDELRVLAARTGCGRQSRALRDLMTIETSRGGAVE